MSVQTDLNWQLAKQKGNLVGYWTKDGQLVRNDLPSWEERKYMRTDANGKLVYQGMPKKKNSELVSKPSTGELNDNHKKEVKDYAKTWREENKKMADQMYVRGLKEEV